MFFGISLKSLNFALQKLLFMVEHPVGRPRSISNSIIVGRMKVLVNDKMLLAIPTSTMIWMARHLCHQPWSMKVTAVVTEIRLRTIPTTNPCCTHSMFNAQKNFVLKQLRFENSSRSIRKKSLFRLLNLELHQLLHRLHSLDGLRGHHYKVGCDPIGMLAR